MISTRLFSLKAACAVALVFALSISHATAASKPAIPPAPVDTRILIKSVDPKGSTVTIKYMRDAKEPDHTYGIDGVTQLKVNNVAGKFADIKVGMVVDSYLERDNDNLDALSVSGYGSTPPAGKPKTPSKSKSTPKTTPNSSSGSTP